MNLAIDESHETIVSLSIFEIQKADANLSVFEIQAKYVSRHACEHQ
jgi:hypothetical protein